jgi:MFS superfamily sulfate permease-like transporter
MSQRTNKLKEAIKAVPANIFSGFVVSLIALPIGLGLAMASDAPPMAGVISAIVGGVVVSVFGGSHVTIAGPGNGLVGVLLVAISTLGLQDAYIAIICSGILLVILGYLRLGKLADFFPSTVIQGMLAAIGLIILGKQFHIMLGNRLSLENNLDYIFAMPEAIVNVFYYSDVGAISAGLSGILSLAILIIYPKLRNRYLQLVPAPMWIVLISIAFSYYCELVLKTPNLIAEDYMIRGIPPIEQLMNDLPDIRFTAFSDWLFWAQVLALALISSVESLLSIKAVDQLDPSKRRSNFTKDIKALGLATAVSGFLGGLNVVTVIARSSVNVNSGGSNRSSNFFHAIFLLIFIVLFSSQLERIPLPALMAILVFTGYKLAAPKNMLKMVSIGKEQLLIYFITLLSTLQIGLVAGIIIGTTSTFIIHVVSTRSILVFTRNFLKPNVLMFQESEGNGQYFVSVKHFCTFVNFFRLKGKLDNVPETETIVLDFSLCEFVDHTVMDSLSAYQELFEKRGGHFEVIGLDTHAADSSHPFAIRKLVPFSGLLSQHLTKRQMALETLSKDYDFQYNPKKVDRAAFLESFIFFRSKKVNYIHNLVKSKQEPITAFDVNFSEGEFIAKEVVNTTMVHINLKHALPIFTLDKEGFLQRLYGVAGFTNISISSPGDFSKRFYLLGEKPNEVRAFFNKTIIHFFESNPYFHIESNGKSLLIFGKERSASIHEITRLIDFSSRLFQVVENDHS